MNERSSHSPPSTQSRLLALIGGPGYLLLLAGVLGSATRTSLAFALAATMVGALVIMAVLAVLGWKAYVYRHSAIRFTLSTAFLVSIPLCIYLAALRWFLQSMPKADWDWFVWTLIAVFAIFWMFITTVVLVGLAEAIVWLTVALRRWFSTKPTTPGSSPLGNSPPVPAEPVSPAGADP